MLCPYLHHVSSFSVPSLQVAIILDGHLATPIDSDGDVLLEFRFFIPFLFAARL